MKRDLYTEAFPFQSPIHSLHPSQCCLQQSLDGSHLRWWCWRWWWSRWSILFNHTIFSFFFVGTPLAWWLLAWCEHLPDAHPNHGHTFVIFCCFTLRLNVPCCFTLNLLSHSHSHISMTLKVVSLYLEMQLAITSTSGTEKSRHLPPTLHCCYQCLSTACWSTDPVPAAPFVQSSLRLPYQIRRLFPLLACTKKMGVQWGRCSSCFRKLHFFA